MNRPRTHSVARAYSTGQGSEQRHWITIETKGVSPGPYQTDELLSEGMSVIVGDGWAERHFNYKDQ